GSIVFLKRDTEATAKELKFTEGYMVKYHENFDASNKNPMSESFVISARVIAMGNGEHVNEWV
ncbi:MAG: phage tail protein, partial [Flavobacteriia bacterium]